MSVRIFSDSACDMVKQTREAFDIGFIPLHVKFGEEEFLDGVDLTHEEFIKRLTASEELPKTSQIPPYVFEEEFRKAVDAGEDVVHISISSKLSGCYQSACIAASEFPQGRVFIIDSENASLGQYILVEYATRLRDQGISAAEIAKTLDEVKKKIRLIAMINTLEYLQKGGRLSKAAALVGSLISIKPVITVVDGEVVILGKARGTRKGNTMLTDFARHSGGFDYSMPIVTAYSGLSSEMLENYIADNRFLVDGKMDVDNTARIQIGAAIGTHVGPGAIGIAFFSREEYQ